jgi:hypothetical protein
MLAGWLACSRLTPFIFLFVGVFRWKINKDQSPQTSVSDDQFLLFLSHSSSDDDDDVVDVDEMM